MTLARFTRTACSLALLGVLAACNGDPEPRIADPTSDSTPQTPPPTSTATTSTSPSPQTESAKAFIRRWAATTFEIQNTGDTAPLAAISQGCANCNSLAKLVNQVYDGGGRIEVPEPRVTDIARIGRRGSISRFALLLHSGKTVVFDSSGNQTTSISGGVSKYEIEILRKSNQWFVVSTQQVEK